MFSGDSKCLVRVSGRSVVLVDVLVERYGEMYKIHSKYTLEYLFLR